MSLRERLAAGERRTDTYRLRVDNDAAARAALTAAIAEGTDTTEAEAALDACYETITVTALAPDDLEGLIAKHPPTADQRDAAWNSATFLPALFAECIDGDVTEQDWQEFTTKGAMSAGEVRDLFDTVMGVNGRSPDLHLLGKGSRGTRS